MWWLALALCCKLGHPPRAVPALAVGEVRAAAVEPGLDDALREGLSGALAARGGLASSGAPEVRVEVLSAGAGAVASGGQAQVHTARLTVRFVQTGAAPRELVLSGERSYALHTGGEPLDASAARAAAFEALAAELCADAAAWLLLAPEGP